MAVWRCRSVGADARHLTGAAVEAAAARHLASRGLVLLDANVRYVDGELDASGVSALEAALAG